LLFFVVAVLFYGIIAILNAPYLISDSRQHPHQTLPDGSVFLRYIQYEPFFDLDDLHPRRARRGVLPAQRCMP
jgi:hypothetical protein